MNLLGERYLEISRECRNIDIIVCTGTQITVNRRDDPDGIKCMHTPWHYHYACGRGVFRAEVATGRRRAPSQLALEDSQSRK